MPIDVFDLGRSCCLDFTFFSQSLSVIAPLFSFISFSFHPNKVMPPRQRPYHTKGAKAGFTLTN
jgi:hypothetical protein